jgi:hypothetical protein
MNDNMLLLEYHHPIQQEENSENKNEILLLEYHDNSEIVLLEYEPLRDESKKQSSFTERASKLQKDMKTSMAFLRELIKNYKKPSNESKTEIEEHMEKNHAEISDNPQIFKDAIEVVEVPDLSNEMKAESEEFLKDACFEIYEETAKLAQDENKVTVNHCPQASRKGLIHTMEMQKPAGEKIDLHKVNEIEYFAENISSESKSIIKKFSVEEPELAEEIKDIKVVEEISNPSKIKIEKSPQEEIIKSDDTQITVDPTPTREIQEFVKVPEITSNESQHEVVIHDTEEKERNERIHSPKEIPKPAEKSIEIIQMKECINLKEIINKEAKAEEFVEMEQRLSKLTLTDTVEINYNQSEESKHVEIETFPAKEASIMIQSFAGEQLWK